MTQGIFVHGSRPKSKKEIKDILASIYSPPQTEVREGEDRLAKHQHDLYCIVIEATSMFGNEFDGSLAKAESENKRGPFTFVGPDPHTSRNFYGNIVFKPSTGKWTVS